MPDDRPRVVAIGELLWDLFPDGPRFGGAPINFAHHVAALGAETSVVTAIGDDELGKRAMDHLRRSALKIDHVSVLDDLPTGTVNVTLDDSGSASYRFNDRDAWDRLRWSAPLATLASHVDAVCFGSLGQRCEPSRSTIQRFVEQTPATALRVFDVNLRKPHYTPALIESSLLIANVLKLNESELPLLCHWFGMARYDAISQIKALASHFDLDVVALTRGSEGSLVLRGSEISRCEAVKTKVIDTVGAGDAYTAALVKGLLVGADLDAINRTATRIGAFVCSQSGATPDLPADLKRF